MKSHFHLFFETLGAGTKIDIIIALKNRPLGVNELAKEIDCERSNVSHALKSLLECGFVSAEKSGRSRVYSLNNETILPLLGLVDKHMKKYCRVCSQAKR